MSKLNNEIVITKILQGINTQVNLDADDLMKIKNVLWINLHDIDLFPQTFEVAVLDEDNDTELLKRFAISKTVENKSKATIHQYLYSAQKLRAFVNKKFKDITTNDIRYYFASKASSNEWSNTTYINQRNNLNSFFIWLLEEEYIEKNPMNKIQAIPKRRVPKYPFTVQELEAMRNVCYDDPRRIALLEFMLASALRVSSVVSLRWKDIDMQRRTGVVKVKGGDINEFDFSKKALFYLQKLLEYRMEIEHRTKEEMMDRPIFTRVRRDSNTKDFEALTNDGVRHILSEISKESGVKNVHPHRFRRTFACQTIERGMPIDRVKGVLMHKNIETTFTYTTYTNETLRQSYRTYCE